DPTYARYLQAVGEVGFRAIASAEDRAVFEAIRSLSVVKEDPTAGGDEVRLAEERLRAAAHSVRYDSESARASRLYWWTAEYGLVGSPEAPRLYGAGLLSSIGEALHCLGPEVARLPLTVGCTEVAFDITRMQPQLFVARDFAQLFEVLETFAATLSCRRGGDHGLAEARRAGTVNHLVLSGGRELSGRVAEVVEGGGVHGLRAALVRLVGPVLASRGGRAERQPWPGEAVVAFGAGGLPERGSFDLRLEGDLRLGGFMVGDGEVVDFSASRAGRTVPVAPWAQLFLSEGLGSVAAGPADPAAWDRWFGELEAFTAGDGEARARSHKAAALPPALGALYQEVRRLREAGTATRERLLAIRERATAFPDDWLLRAEVTELLPDDPTAELLPQNP
ncbi:MAG TPA: hypothetical protein VMG58_13090, partial [Candidatus Sulfotelmatobacter sp.]|nr:hypothetical protein [Candidatus Sulfotelmatobacter sp.]